MHETITDQALGLFAGLITIIAGVFAWFGKRQINRIDAIEKSHVDRSEYNQTIQSLRDEIKTGHKETQSLIIDLYKNQKH